MTASKDLSVKIEIDGISVVRPGDTLVVATRRAIPRDEADQFKQKIRDRLPGLADVAIIAGVDALAVYRPDDDRVTYRPDDDAH